MNISSSQRVTADRLSITNHQLRIFRSFSHNVERSTFSLIIQAANVSAENTK